jgi:hypothetical protein
LIVVEEEALLFQSFIVPKKRQHYVELLSTKRGREKVRLSLDHFSDLDPRFCKQVPSGRQRPTEIFRLLSELGAPAVCRILSSDSNLDGREMSLADALTETVGHGMGTFLSCLPGFGCGNLLSAYFVAIRIERPHSNPNFDPRTQAVENRHQAIGRESAKVSVSDAREVGRGEAGSALSSADAQLITIECLDDLGRQQGLQLFEIGVLAAEIAEDVSAAANQFQSFTFHLSASFSFFNRSLTRSISCFGVLMPCFDFFWKAWMAQISSASWTA